MFLTIFTPTYNRAYTITRLYQSLLQQTCNDFEWLIIDDGSTDNTQELIQSFIQENKVAIRYFKQENGGKHRAINNGVQWAQGELFFIVDSDDYLAKHAIEQIYYHYDNIKDEADFAGICGCKAYFSGKKVGGEAIFTVLDCSSLDFRYKYRMQGDMAEVFKTEILKQYPFPEIEGEKFCPEALIWNRIAIKYKLRYFNENIYLCEYLPDGLTSKIFEIRKQSPQASVLYYSELGKMPIPFIQKIKANINYWRFAKYLNKPFLQKWGKINPFLSLIGLPVSLIFLYTDKI
jgi:glycosyltransferase involved in cell wall biosynthesis